MTVALNARRKPHWIAISTLILGLLLCAASEAWAQAQPPQTTPPARRTPPKNPARPIPAPNNGQPGDPAAQPLVTPPSGQEPGQANEPVGRDETGRVRIDPEIQRKIDEMLQQDEAGRKAAENQPNAPGTPTPNPAAAQNQPAPAQPPVGGTPDAMKTPAQRAAERRRARAGADGPAANPGGQPVGNIPQPQPVDAGMPTEPPGETTVLQIEPEPEANPVPPEERQYGFSIKNGTYEQLIKGFAHQTGLGVLGETPPRGNRHLRIHRDAQLPRGAQPHPHVALQLQAARTLLDSARRDPPARHPRDRLLSHSAAGPHVPLDGGI